MKISKSAERLNERVKCLGLKPTKQRVVICQVFFSQSGHRSAEDILKEARLLDAKVSLATVYRTLKLLQENGLAESHNFQDSQALFEPKLDDDHHHDHLICTSCGHIVEFVDDNIERLQLEVAESQGFLITSHKMELYGLCKDCRNRGDDGA
ncbi:MAG TPA: Fur family transcriptional regulator [Myxococcota bacterium]|nr:Fur family transcriptional regulator [Myxococcota bacterium]